MSLPQSIVKIVQNAKTQHQLIVFVSGVFDLLHQEHRAFLKKASELGDVLIVGVESDKRVKQMKGDDRPIWDQNRRKQAVESVEEVTQAFILPEEFNTPIHHAELIKELRPNYLAVSSHSPHQAEKARIMGLVGGEVKVVYDHNPDVSTTLLVDQFTDR